MGHCSCNHCHTERKRKVSPYLLPAISFGMLLGGIAMQVAETGFFDPTVRFIWYALAYLPVGLPVMKEAVEIIGSRALTECSGNVTKERLKKIREIGVDFVSSGALTHSAPILDISLKNLKPTE